MKSILLYGEGATDYGVQDYKTGDWLEGPVQSFMRTIFSDIEIECVVSLKDRPKIQKKTLQPFISMVIGQREADQQGKRNVEEDIKN